MTDGEEAIQALRKLVIDTKNELMRALPARQRPRS